MTSQLKNKHPLKFEKLFSIQNWSGPWTEIMPELYSENSFSKAIALHHKASILSIINCCCMLHSHHLCYPIHL